MHHINLLDNSSATRSFNTKEIARPSCVAPSRFVTLSLAVAGLAFAVNASAQTDDSAVTDSGAKLTIGLGTAYAPRYEGSDDYKARALPLINYRNGRFFAGALGGVGYNFASTPELEFGPVLSYRPGRDESDAVRLRGLGDIDASADLGAFVRWNLRPFFLHASVKKGISGDVKGTHARFGAGYALTLAPTDRLVFDASAEWSDAKEMQAWFGVTPAQALRSGMPAYQADAGIRRYGVGVNWTHTFNAQWFSTVGVGLYRLGNQAANSPITVDRNQGVFSASIGYRF